MVQTLEQSFIPKAPRGIFINMFQSISKWPFLFWNIFSVISFDARYKRLQFIYSTLLMVSCVYNFFITSDIVCVLEGQCINSLSAIIKGLFLRVVAGTCFLSRLVIILDGKKHLIRYKKNVDQIQAITPLTHSEIKILSKISSQLVISCLLLTVPVNCWRLWLLSKRSDFTVVVFVLMYFQNINMYCVETHFNILCFTLNQKFVGINKDLTALKIDTVVRNKYPLMSPSGRKYGKRDDTIDYNEQVLLSVSAGHPMIHFVEQLKIKHRLCCAAVRNLNDLFGIHLGLSMCSLCLYAMFDLYYHFLGIMSANKSYLFIYGWMLQYTVRFGSVTVLAHLTIKQVPNSKRIFYPPVRNTNMKPIDVNVLGRIFFFKKTRFYHH